MSDWASSMVSGLGSPSSPSLTPQTDRLRALEHDWDSYGGIPTTEAALAAAEGVERSFTLVPHSDGGFQIEIHAAGLDVEVEIGPDGAFVSSWVGKAQ